MRTTAKIVGIGTRRTGTGKKTGRPYDFTPLSIIFTDKDTQGYRAAECAVDTSILEYVGGVKLNEEREIIYHGFGSNMTIDGIL